MRKKPRTSRSRIQFLSFLWVLSYPVLAALAVALVVPTAWAQYDSPPFQFNSQKYRVSEQAKPATGRSGSAELHLRALQGKEDAQGQRPTDIEVRTKDFESAAPPPGRITKLQVKVFDSQQNLQSTTLYNQLNVGGSHTITSYTLEHGQLIQVQGNIRDIDRNRTDVVTIQTAVKLRPDLVVTELDAPDSAPVGSAVNIGATVIEKNGDVGARADCVLLVDGEEADKAPQIWVDAGGTISCVFTYTFETPGDKTLKLVAENVSPHDYDATNNSATTVIQITQPVVDRPFWYYAYVADYEFNYSGRNYATVDYQSVAPHSYAGGYEYNYTYSQKGWYQHLMFYGWTLDRWTFPIQEVSVSMTFDGETLDSMAFTDLPAQWNHDYTITYTSGYPSTWSVNYTCASRWWDYHWLHLCVYDSSWNSYTWSGSYIYYGRYAGDVTYHSDGWVRYWYQFNQANYSGYYTWNYDSRYAFGPSRLALSATSVLGFEVKIIDDGRQYYGAPTITSLQPLEWAWDQPRRCYSYSYSSTVTSYIPGVPPYLSSGDVYACYEYTGWSKGMRGYTFGRSGP